MTPERANELIDAVLSFGLWDHGLVEADAIRKAEKVLRDATLPDLVRAMEIRDVDPGEKTETGRCMKMGAAPRLVAAVFTMMNYADLLPPPFFRDEEAESVIEVAGVALKIHAVKREKVPE